MANKNGKSHNGKGWTSEERVAAKERLMLERPWCHWCGKRFDKPLSYYRRWVLPRNRPTLEHIKPRCLGGSNDSSNLALACFRCNQERGRKYANRTNIIIGLLSE